MASDALKNLERARRSLEKNKLREAVAAYQAVLEEAPTHQESLQALADIFTRLNEPARAAQYYVAQFDRLVEAGDLAKASAIYSRFLRPLPQPPDRLMRYAALLQKQNRIADAVEQFSTVAELFLQEKRQIEAMACYESLAALDPENPARHVALAQLAASLGHADLASRAFLRAGQLSLAASALDEALDYFGRAHQLLPTDRSGALLFAEAKLRMDDAGGAAALLEPFAPNEKDGVFLALYGESLFRSAQLDRARDVFECYYKAKPEGFVKLFELVGAYLQAAQDDKAASLLRHTKDLMRAARKEIELPAQMDKIVAAYPASLPIAEAVAKNYEELNRETQYFDALVRLFDLYLVAGKLPEACEVLDRLVDIDPYDYRNQDRVAQLEGKVDPSFLRNVQSRAAKAANVTTRTQGFGAGSQVSSPAEPATEEARAQHALEDLIVQVEIFLQYSLQSKAVERLSRISELFPGEEEKNERLRALYERANWWPKGSPPKPSPKPAAPSAAPMAAAEPAAPATTSALDTHRDLAAIAEINRLMYRQSTPREVLASTAAEIGKHLRVARCLVAVGSIGETTHLTAEYAAPGVPPAGTARMASVVELLSKHPPDALGGIELRLANTPALADFAVESALGIVLTDKETQTPAGALLVGDASARKWKPNESFFLQAVGDQLVLSANHTRLRSLVRSLAVTDERTGLLSRGAYIDCLLAESNRSRAQHTPLSLIVLQIDRGPDVLRQNGDAAVDNYIEQIARALSSAIRQTDIAVKYTAWSLVFILPDTSLENAGILAEKLRQVAATVRPAWGGQELTVSAVVAESTSRPADETEDRVTEWINRAESGLDEVRQRGGNSLLSLATP
ncbi:MAG TPA: diguanylate cyclase [Candidatus Dormibacteraeota bacterium]|nr:diguanylate cyclase [Candidatus Dormibacteraeota bacterium]